MNCLILVNRFDYIYNINVKQRMRICPIDPLVDVKKAVPKL